MFVNSISISINQSINQPINLSMAFSKIAHSIKHRKVAKDVFITPPHLALKCINWHDYNTTENLTWFDGCRNSGSFYNQYPVENDSKGYAEILENLDFFDTPPNSYDIGATNPPFSILNDWISHSCKVFRKEFGLLMGVCNLTAKRIETCNKAGFYLKKMNFFKVFSWFGMSCYVVFSNEIDKNIVGFDRKVWRAVEL